MKILCSHRPPCPGCPEFNRPARELPQHEILEALSRRQGAQMTAILTGNPAEYRIRAKLAVRGRFQNPKIGIFQKGSHRIVDMPHCPIHHPAINQTVVHVKSAMRSHQIAPYVEKPRLGLLRYLQVVVERATKKVQLVLVVTDLADPHLTAFCAALVRSMGDLLHSLWLNQNTSPGNSILGREFRLVCGEPYLEENFADRVLHYHPAAFGQANLDLAEEMVRWLERFVPQHKRILEFHCGVGAIGLGLLANSASFAAN